MEQVIIKLRWKPLLVLLALIILSYAAYLYYIINIKLVPEELFSETLENVRGLESYRYTVDLRLQTGEHERYITDIKGEKARDASFHIWGTIEGTEIDVYHINRITYMKTEPKGKWMIIPGNEVFDNNLFMTEINPLASFNFENVSDLQYFGKEKINGKNLHILICKPAINNPFLEKHWQDFEYKFWVRRNGPNLVKAEVKAKLRAKPTDTMHMVIELKDYNARITLKPPVD